ncbi:MAG: rRNA processing protein Mis3 [Amphiamblys sp. WSBS2006]|nr:MAG: rRNA processing protein Mis3 [Amphiamblys sp. WSBS2006]
MKPRGRVILEESSFSVLHSKNVQEHITESQKETKAFLSKKQIAFELDGCEMVVKTTENTEDPCAVLLARDMITLLSRAVPVKEAKKVFDEGVASEIIQIKNLADTKEKFVKRRQRLIGGCQKTIKAIRKLTGCYVKVEGGTVAVVGTFGGIKEVRTIVVGCMKSKHPVDTIKETMIRRELSKDESMKKESWDRFIPKKQKTKQKKKHFKEKKEKSIYPPAPEKRKIDLEIESGEYFLKKKKASSQKKTK